MEPHETEEAKKARAEQTDPMIMYLIVREELEMSVGKTAAQVGHATQMILLKYFDAVDVNTRLDEWKGVPLEEISSKVKEFHEWLTTSFRKVVLRADEKEWVKIKNEMKNKMVLVVDAGLTELEPNTETVIGL